MDHFWKKVTIRLERGIMGILLDNSIGRNESMLKKIKVIVLGFCCSVILISCNTYKQASCPYLLKQIYMCDTETGWALSRENEVLFTKEGIQNFQEIKQVTDISSYTDDFINATFIDEYCAYITYFAADNENLVVEYTNDGGVLWEQINIKYGDYAEICDAGSAFINFADNKEGYLLYCSTPGMGQMTKLLFHIDGIGKTFTFIADLTDEILGYPQGLSFANKEIGYIAVNYHGNSEYMYKTEDGGKTWESVEIYTQSDNVNYIESYTPVFTKKDRKKGMLVLKEVTIEDITYKVFMTNDQGNKWIESGKIPSDSLLQYSVVSDRKIYIIDTMGRLYEIFN